jgi:hypothetical protein
VRLLTVMLAERASSSLDGGVSMIAGWGGAAVDMYG